MKLWCVIINIIISLKRGVLMKIKKQSRWLYDCKEVQEDLRILQKKYMELGYEFSLDECYDIWYLYSEMLSANWINAKGSVKQSIDYVINNKNCWE